MSTIQERLRAAVPDGTLLDEAADYIDQSETEIGRMIDARRHDLDEIARLTAENERLHFDYGRLADRTGFAALVAAWNDEGVNPTHHHNMKVSLHTQWPVLYNAIVALVGS